VPFLDGVDLPAILAELEDGVPCSSSSSTPSPGTKKGPLVSDREAAVSLRHSSSSPKRRHREHRAGPVRVQINVNPTMNPTITQTTCNSDASAKGGKTNGEHFLSRVLQGMMWAAASASGSFALRQLYHLAVHQDLAGEIGISPEDREAELGINVPTTSTMGPNNTALPGSDFTWQDAAHGAQALTALLVAARALFGTYSKG
jgi:hypothetical protein